MPGKSGFEVCQHIKQNEKYKHIPVMLLVGSFEPFDEAEARRVGADDILTKPFQSIRRLIDRVGALVSSPPPVKEAPTADLPKAPEKVVEEEPLNTQELKLTTADTLPLPAESQSPVEPQVVGAAVGTVGSSRDENMETGKAEPSNDGQESSDALLEIGDLEPLQVAEAEDSVLELDDVSHEIAVPAAYEPAGRVFV